jgi:hypothetical protein
LLQDIQDMIGVDIRTVIIRDSNGSSHCAVIDTSSAIWDITKLGSCNRRGAAARWDGIVVTGRAIVELTSRGSTVVSTFTTPA